MRITSQLLRSWTISAFLAAWSVFFLGIAIPVITTVAQKHAGLDQIADALWAGGIAMIQWMAIPWVVGLVGGGLGLISGLTAGVWLDALVKRGEGAPIPGRPFIYLPLLSERIDDLSAAILERVRELKVPSNPDYPPDLLRQEEDGRKRVTEIYISDAINEIKEARKSIALTETEEMVISRADGIIGLEQLTVLFSSVASRLRAIKL